jgi:hypothetical protein
MSEERQVLGGQGTSLDLAVNRRWTCPLCPHPSPGRHGHTMWELVDGKAQVTGRQCPGRARGTVVSVTVPWPPPEAVVERAFRVFAAGGVGGTDEWRRRLAHDVLAAALGQNHELGSEA